MTSSAVSSAIGLFLPWLSPVHASLAYAISVVLLNMAIVYPLYRKRIFLRI
jgi:predicted acyltransferase